MPISVTCPSGHKINASEKYAGKTVKCPKCSEPIQIPTMTMKVEEEVIDLSGAVAEVADPFSSFNGDVGATGGGTDPFADFAAQQLVAYSPVAYNPAAMTGYGAPPAQPATQSNERSGGNKSSGGNKRGVLIAGLVGGGVLMILGMIAVAVVAIWWFSGSSASEVDLAKEYLVAQMQSDPSGPKMNQEQLDDRVAAMQKLVSPTAGVYLGFDAAQRLKLRRFLMANGISESEAAFSAVDLTGKLKKVCQEFDLDMDKNGHYSFPPDWKPQIDIVKQHDFSEEAYKAVPKALHPVMKLHKSNQATAEQEEWIFLIMIGFQTERYVGR